MREKLLKLLNNSYSPYSKFRVAAIVKTKDNKEFCGVNIENASFGATICAERNAINCAISNGYKTFDSLYIMCEEENIGMPCFLCRQTISEFFDNETKIICMNPQGLTKEFTKKELCPYPFGEDDLK